MESSLVVRPASAGDLEALWSIRYADEVAGDPDPPEPGPVPAYLGHVLATGQLLVAERDGQVVGFAGLVRRGETAFLTDLFVDPARQSGAVGRTLLRAILPAGGATPLTLSSTDPRALALYTRAGMRPRWPNVLLEAESAKLGRLDSTGIEIVEAEADDPSFVGWDAKASGRPRPEDVAFWLREEAGVPLWIRRAGAVVGYAIVRRGAGRLWHPEAVTIGPIGVRRLEDAAGCVAAVVDWARSRGSYLEIAVPGPHPALAPLLEARFRIVYVETFCAGDADGMLIDPGRYVGSGGDLF
jgi:GNAT superfamily N-acetyltransferase